MRGHDDPGRLAQEAQAPVLLERSGQQPRLGQDLEAVADADHRPAGAGEGARRPPSPARSGPGRRDADSRRGRTHRAGRPRRPGPGRRRRARAARPRRRPPRPPAPHRARSWCRERRRRRCAAPIQIASSSSRLCSITGLASRRSASSLAVERAAVSSGASTSKLKERPARTWATLVEAERRERPLDGRPLRIGDPGAQLHLDPSPEPHAVAPYQSASARPVTRS